MAGGNSGDLRGAFPNGEDSVVVWHSPTINVAGALSAIEVCLETLPFACKCVKAEFSARVLTDNDAGADIVVTIQDDTGTPKKWVNGANLGASWAAGSPAIRDLTVDKTVEFNAGALLTILLTSEASDVITDGRFTLWLKPTNA